jgi:hypothetical protein
MAEAHYYAPAQWQSLRAYRSASNISSGRLFRAKTAPHLADGSQLKLSALHETTPHLVIFNFDGAIVSHALIC